MGCDQESQRLISKESILLYSLKVSIFFDIGALSMPFSDGKRNKKTSLRNQKKQKLSKWDEVRVCMCVLSIFGYYRCIVAVTLQLNNSIIDGSTKEKLIVTENQDSFQTHHTSESFATTTTIWPIILLDFCFIQLRLHFFLKNFV